MSEQKLILVVDDEPDFAEVLVTKLAGAGFKTATAKDGVDGVAAARTLKPALIILDVRMPKMDGITALSELKKDNELSKIKVILLSSFKDTQAEEAPKEEERAKASGAEAFLSKSTNLDEIVEEARRLIS